MYIILLKLLLNYQKLFKNIIAKNIYDQLSDVTKLTIQVIFFSQIFFYIEVKNTKTVLCILF